MNSITAFGLASLTVGITLSSTIDYLGQGEYFTAIFPATIMVINMIAAIVSCKIARKLVVRHA